MITDTEAARLRQMLAANWATKEAEALSALPRLLAQRDELLAALKALDHATDDDPRGEIDGPDFDMAKQRCRAALAKASGDAA